MSSKQIFGWTEPETPKEGYVTFIAVHREDDKQWKFEIRDREGKYHSIVIPTLAATDLVDKIVSEFAEDR